MVDLTGKKIRGNTVYFLVVDIKNKYGQEGFQKVVDGIPDEEIRDFLSKPIISNEWYPLRYQVGFLKSIIANYGKPVLREMQHANAEKQFTGVYGLLAKFITMERVKNRTTDMWRKQFDPGTLTVEFNGDNEINLFLKDFETDDVHAWVVCVWLERFIEIIEKRKVRFYSYEYMPDGTIHFKYTMQAKE